MAKGPEKGRDWHKEVGSPLSSPGLDKKRGEFYRERAKLKLGVPDLEKVLDEPEKYGFKTDEELQRFPGFSRDIPKEKEKAKSGQTLSEILEAYFREHLKSETADEKALASRAAREAYLSLYYITNGQKNGGGKPINVDLIRRGETVEIVDGRLYIYKKGADGRIANVRVEGAYLRRPKLPRLVSPGEKGIVGRTRVAEEEKPEDFELPLEGPPKASAEVARAPEAEAFDALFEKADELGRKAGELEGDITRLTGLIEAANQKMREKKGTPEEVRKSIRVALDEASALKEKIFQLKKETAGLLEDMRDKQATVSALVDEGSRQTLARTIQKLEESVTAMGEMYAEVGRKEAQLMRLSDLATPELPRDDRG